MSWLGSPLTARREGPRAGRRRRRRRPSPSEGGAVAEPGHLRRLSASLPSPAFPQRSPSAGGAVGCPAVIKPMVLAEARVSARGCGPPAVNGRGGDPTPAAALCGGSPGGLFPCFQTLPPLRCFPNPRGARCGAGQRPAGGGAGLHTLPGAGGCMCRCVGTGGGDGPSLDSIYFASFVVQANEAPQLMESPGFRGPRR